MLCHNNDKIKKNDNNNIISLHSACSKNVMPIFKICCSWVNLPFGLFYIILNTILSNKKDPCVL